jgi:hypothetical protein
MAFIQPKARLFALFLIFASSPLGAQIGTAVPNWTVPPYQRSSASGGITTMSDVTPGVAFVGVDPCRLVDTRAAAGFPAGYGPPFLSAGVQRNFDLDSAAHCPGIPSGVEAYSLNITVTNTGGPGFVKIWPAGSGVPDVSTIN